MSALADADAWSSDAVADDRLADGYGLVGVVRGFDLTPYRAARIRLRRRRARIGCVAAIACGLLGAQLLQTLAERQRQTEDARRLGLERRLDALAPELGELARLERRVAADDERRARLAALQPRRWQLIALLDGLADAAQDGIAVTEAVISDDNGSRGQVLVTGLADDADVVARWATRLAGHGALDAVSLDELRRLKAASSDDASDASNATRRLTLHGDGERSSDQGLNMFRVRGQLRRQNGPIKSPAPVAAAVTRHHS